MPPVHRTGRSTEGSIQGEASDSLSPKMAADMLDFGSGFAGRAEVSPFDKGQVTAEAGSCPPPTGVHQLHQQQNEAECCAGYARLLFSNTVSPAPFLLPSIGAGAGAGPPPRNPLYSPPEHFDRAGALGECSRVVPLPIQSLTSTESSSPSHTQFMMLAPVVDGNTTLSNTNANGGFCSTASMRTASSGLKALASPAAPAGAASRLTNAPPCVIGRAPPGLHLAGNEELLVASQQQQKQHGQQQGHHLIAHSSPEPLHPQLCQQQKHRQQLQQLHLQRQHFQSVPVKQPQVQHQMHQHLLQQQMQHQQQMQQHQYQSIEQHMAQRQLRLQLQQSLTQQNMSDRHATFHYPQSQDITLNCSSGANRWLGMGYGLTGAADTAAPPFFPSAQYGQFMGAAVEAGQRRSSTCTSSTSRRIGVHDERGPDLSGPASFEVWQAKLVLGQRESRPLRLSRFEMVEAYAKSTLCLSCDSMEHKITNCPFGEFVCPNCHRSSHRGEHCPLPCRFCFERHAGISVNECIRRTVRQPLERLLGVKMPLDASLSRRQERESSSSNGECGDLATLALRKADRPNTPHGRSVYVSNMLPGTTKESLRSAINFLLDHGQVVCVEMRERSNYLPYAFVELSSLQAAYELVQYKKAALVIGDQELKVQFKKIGLACTTPTRNSVAGSAEDVETHKRSPIMLMAPFTPTGQTVQDVCRLVAYKLAHDFGLPSPGAPPAYFTGDADTLALLSRTMAEDSNTVAMAPGSSGLTCSSKPTESRESFHQTFHNQEKQQTETEMGCHWVGEAKKLNGNAKAFDPSGFRSDPAAETNLQRQQQVQSIQSTSQQVYSRYLCTTESIPRSDHCSQRPLELLSPNESRQLLHQLHALGTVNSCHSQSNKLDIQEQRAQLDDQNMQVLQQQKCLGPHGSTDTPHPLSAFPFREHQLMPGVHSAFCRDTPTCRAPLQSLGESGASCEQHQAAISSGEAADGEQSLTGTQNGSLKNDSTSVGGVTASRNHSYEDLTPFPGVLTSEMTPTTTFREAWGFSANGSSEAGSKLWRVQQVDGPTSNATASTSLSASLGCESLASPSTCRSRPPSQVKDAEERSNSGQQRASIQKTEGKTSDLGSGQQSDYSPPASTAHAIKEQEQPKGQETQTTQVETEQVESPVAGAGNSDNDEPGQQPSLQRPNFSPQEAGTEAHSSASSSVMRTGTGSYFEMGVSGAMMPSAGDTLEGGMHDRSLSFSQPSCYRQWTLERGDSSWTGGSGTTRAFSRRAHQMGLPSLVHALKPNETPHSDAGDSGPSFRTGSGGPPKTPLSAHKRVVSCSSLVKQEVQAKVVSTGSQQEQTTPSNSSLESSGFHSVVESSPATPVGSSRGPSCLAPAGPLGTAAETSLFAVPATDTSSVVPTKGERCVSPGHRDEARGGGCQHTSPVCVGSNTKCSILFPRALKGSMPSLSEINEAAGIVGSSVLKDRSRLSQVGPFIEGYLPSAGSLASSAPSTAVHFSPWGAIGSCAVTGSRSRFPCRLTTPTPRKASSTEPRGIPASLQDATTHHCFAFARRASPGCPKQEAAETTQLSTTKVDFPVEGDSQVSAQMEKECARTATIPHESMQDPPSIITPFKPAADEQRTTSLILSSHAAAPDLVVHHSNLANVLDHEKVQQQAAGNNSVTEEFTGVGCSQPEDGKPTGPPPASDSSVELLLAQIDDITKQLPPKVIEAVWASIASARANATTAAANSTGTAATGQLGATPQTAVGTEKKAKCNSESISSS